MKKHLYNFLLNSLPFFIGLLPSVFAIPIYLNTIGVEQLGIYYLYLAMVGIGGSFDLGITQTVVKFLSEYKNKSKIFSSLLIGSSVLIITLSNLFIVLLVLLGYIIARVLNFWELPGIHVLIIFVVGLILQMWFNFFLSILKGLEDFKKMASIELINKLIFTGLGMGLAYYTKNVNYVLLAHIISLILQNIILIKKLNDYKFKNYSIGLKFKFFKIHLWDYSKWILIQNTLGFLNGNIDKFLIASLVNLSSLAIYNTANNLARLVPSFFSKGLSYLLPHVSQIANKEKVRKFYISYSYKFNLIMAFIYIVAIFCAPFAISLYLHNSSGIVDEVVECFKYLLISSVFAATALLSFNVFNALGEVRTNTLIPLFGNIFSLICLVIGGYFWGFWGVVFAKLNNVLVSIVIRTVTYNKVFQMKDPLIGLKMAFPILAAIFVYELIILI